MIVSINALPKLQSEWKGALQMRERMRHLVLSTHAFNTIQSPAFGDVLYNLPLILAFDVLTHVLLQIREEGRLPGTRRDLDNLMDRAKESLPWANWRGLRDAVNRQIAVAHDGKLFDDVQCLQDITLIENQLKAWGVVA